MTEAGERLTSTQKKPSSRKKQKIHCKIQTITLLNDYSNGFYEYSVLNQITYEYFCVIH